MSEEVHAVFREKKIPEFLNSMNIVLIPKTQGPESIGSYRPISLCNSVYNIVSKILIGRIRPFLDQLVPLVKQRLFLVGGEWIMLLLCRRLSIPWGELKGKVVTWL